MIRDIRKKTVILSGRLPFSDEVKEFAAAAEKKDWIYRNLKLEGSGLGAEEAEGLINGQYVLGASVWEHVMAERLEKVLHKMNDAVSRGLEMDLKLLNTFHNIIAGTAFDTGKGYRKRSVILGWCDHSPSAPTEIFAEMIRLQALIDDKSSIPGSSGECFLAAAQIHNEILRIFPYGDEDRILARSASAYFLMTKGYPAVAPDMKENEYNDLAAYGIKNIKHEGLKNSLLRAVLERTELMIRLTAY